MPLKLPDDGGVIDWEMESVVGEPGKYMIKTEQDEQPILEHNKALRNAGYTGDLSFGRHIASIPFILWNRWLKKYPELKAGSKHPDYETTLHRLLNEHSYLKVNDDKLGKIRI